MSYSPCFWQDSQRNWKLCIDKSLSLDAWGLWIWRPVARRRSGSGATPLRPLIWNMELKISCSVHWTKSLYDSESHVKIKIMLWQEISWKERNILSSFSLFWSIYGREWFWNAEVSEKINRGNKSENQKICVCEQFDVDQDIFL